LRDKVKFLKTGAAIMKHKTEKTLAQKELVNILNKLGFDINERKIDDWKAKTLLPPFDLIGSGLGKGKGRENSLWKDRRSIIEQAIWVYRLMRVYHNAQRIYLPLWILGHSVPVELVRTALFEPLEGATRSLQEEAISNLEQVESYERVDGIVEDFIGDLVFKWVSTEQFAKTIKAPQPIIEAAMNIFFNKDYELNDTEFEEGKIALSGWKKKEEEIKTVLLEGLETDKDVRSNTLDPNGIELLFNNAQFIQEYFQHIKFLNLFERQLKKILKRCKPTCKLFRNLLEDSASL
jgi:hypothetical protein